jgi:hypothetical protein
MPGTHGTHGSRVMIVTATGARSELGKDRGETNCVLTTSTFESKQMNRAIAAEFVIAVLATQMDALRRILGTSELTLPQFGWALIPPVILFVLWELGKLVARTGLATGPSPA